jgi:hypothetical protein
VGKPEATAIVVIILVFALALMMLGWRGRKRRQSHLAEPEEIPSDLGALRGTFDGLYVSTTVAGEPLNRIAVRGLGFRSKARITVAERGVAIELAGGRDVFIPSDTLRGVDRANLTIDRVVETGGLVLVAWSLGDDAVDTYLRADDTSGLLGAIDSIIRTTTGGQSQ